jgi:hypothetical protein
MHLNFRKSLLWRNAYRLYGDRNGSEHEIDLI